MKYNLTYAEELVTVMLTVLRLSTVDQDFFNSISDYALAKNMVTSNQDKLFRKVVAKYSKQLQRIDVNVTTVLNLPWRVKVVASEKTYTDAHINIENRMIYVRSPYNKKFIRDVRKLNEEYLSVNWNGTERRYETKYNTKALLYIVTLLRENYPVIHYCPTTLALLNEVEQYKSCKYWHPTLVRLHDSLYIIGANDYVIDAIADIPLNYELTTLAILVQYGISIDDSVINHILSTTLYTKEEISFACTYENLIEHRDLPKVINWLSNLGCDLICESRGAISTEHRLYVLRNNIEIVPRTSARWADKFIAAKKPVVVRMSGVNALSFTYHQLKPFKTIGVVNSDPIRIR